MYQQIKKYFSLVLLVLFLFPMVEKGLHSFEHANDFHCNASDKHFHEQEHSCSICDYTINDSFSAPNNDFQFIVSIHKSEFEVACENVNAPSAFSDIPSRAPPLA